MKTKWSNDELASLWVLSRLLDQDAIDAWSYDEEAVRVTKTADDFYEAVVKITRQWVFDRVQYLPIKGWKKGSLGICYRRSNSVEETPEYRVEDWTDAEIASLWALSKLLYADCYEDDECASALEVANVVSSLTNQWLIQRTGNLCCLGIEFWFLV